MARLFDRNLRQVPSMTIQAQYRTFLDGLEKETGSFSAEKMKDVDSKELIKAFLAKPALYTNIEMIMQAISVGCIKLSEESVAESMISRYNIHNQELRKVSEETANNEMFIAYNGPEIGESNQLLVDALKEHFKHKDWHFVKQTGLFSSESKTVTRLLKKKGRLPFY